MGQFDHLGKGRIFKPDPRDHQHLMAAARPLATSILAEGVLTPTQEKYLRLGKRRHTPGTMPTWDQGNSSRCCSFGTNRWLVASPVRNEVWVPPDYIVDPSGEEDYGILGFTGRIDDFYDRIRNADGIPMPHEGSTVRACFDVLKEAGWVSGYEWAFTAEAVVRELLINGPVVAGTDWTVPMYSPTNYGRGKGTFCEIVAAGDGKYDVDGGHCFLIFEVNVHGWCPDGSRGWVRIKNSWSDGWGDGGEANLSILQLGMLAVNQGEFAKGKEVKRKKVTGT